MISPEDSGITDKTTAVILQGMGGIGKTFLALKLAIGLEAEFPGGVIRINVGPQVASEEETQVLLIGQCGKAMAVWTYGQYPYRC